MRLYEYLRIERRTGGAVLFKGAQIIAPSCLTGGGDLVLEARTGEVSMLARIALLRAFLHTLGIRRAREAQRGRYGYEVVRLYEESDLSASELLTV